MSVVSLCLGIDVSPKRLGWALARLEDGAPVACGCEAIELPANGWKPGWVRDHLVLALFRNQVEGEIHYVAVERPALPPKSGTNSAFNAGRAYQEAISAVRRRWPWAVVDEMQSSEWRRLAGLSGNASKNAVMLHAVSTLGFVLPGQVRKSEGLTDLTRASQDAADAACIAVAGVRRNAETLAVPAGEAGR